MKAQYFPDTDTVLVTFHSRPVTQTKDLDESTLLDLDSNGNLISITIEHARERAEIANFSFKQVAA